MKITYQPEGAEPQTWMFRAAKLMNVEGEEIERKTGLTFDEWVQKLPPGSYSFLAVKALLYILLKRSNPTLKWDQVQFAADEVQFDLELDEKVELRDELLAKIANGSIPEGMAQAADETVDALNQEIAEEQPGTDEGPKETPSSDSETTGGQPSPQSSTSTLETSTV